MNAIVVEAMGKRFRQYRDRGSLWTRLARGGRDVHDMWALRDIDFTVERGATLGVIGRNGSGKTTLLRLLSGVSGPSTGRIRIEGRIAPLIGIGVGFNRELTGRENVRINGRLLGMSAVEVTDAFDRIVAFAQLEEFIDTPVKFYSSGMFLRLAFSVAIHTEPDILLVDEILAVGDVAFQNKCFERMRALQDAGTTVVVVTHNLQVLQQLTARTVVLDRGRIRFDGPTEQALERYHEILQEPPPDLDTHSRQSRPGVNFTGLAATTLTIVDDQGRSRTQVTMREPMWVHVQVQFREEVEDPIVGLVIERPGLGLLFATANEPRGDGHTYGPDRPMDVRVRLGSVPLLPQTYTVRAQVRSVRHDVVHGTSPAVLFHVTGAETGAGTVAFDPSIEIDGEAVAVIQPRLTSPRE